MRRRSDAELIALVRARTRRMEPRMREAYVRAVQQLRRELSVDVIVRAIEAGRIESVVTQPMLDRAFMSMRAELQRDVQEGFRYGVKGLPGGGVVAGTVGVQFNFMSPLLRQAMQELDARVLSFASDAVRETVRQHLLNAMQAGVSPVQAARSVRDVIGLTPYQERIVQNFEQKLRSGTPRMALENARRDKRFDRTIKKAAKEGTDLTEAQIQTMTRAYTSRFIAYHAETIARTATLQAYAKGQELAIREAIAVGVVDESRAIKRWVTVGDSKVREEHMVMNGEERPLNRAFSNGRMIPDEWNCRCILDYDMTPLPQGDPRERQVVR
jgi:hypothetical protein